MNNILIVQTAASVIATYAIHSTLLLMIAWLVCRLVVKHAGTKERIWKWSTVVPLFSTAFVLCWPQTQPVWEWRLDSSPTTVAAREVQPALTESARLDATPAEDVEPTTVAETEIDVGSLLPEITIESATPNEAESHESAFADVGRDLEETWAVQIIPGKTTLEPRTPVLSQSGTAHSAAPSDIATQESQPAASIVASALTVASATPESPGLLDACQAKAQEDVSFPFLLIAMFAAGFAVLGISRFVVIQVRIIRILGRSQAVNDGRASKLLTQLLTDRNIRQTVRLLSSDAVSEPAATGVWQWTIVLPNDLPSRLADSELSALLCHELGHLVRRDTVWLHFGRLITALLPWQLLNYVAIQKWQQSAELECDEWTLNSNVEPLTLARVLTNVAEWKTGNRPNVGLPATAPPLSLRIEALLNRGNEARKSQSKLQRLLFTTVLVCTLCGVSVFGPRMTWASPEKIEAVDLPLDSFPSRLSLAETEELSNLRAEFHSLSADLQVALELLAEQEFDPDLGKSIHKITNRLEQIEIKIHQKGLE